MNSTVNNNPYQEVEVNTGSKIQLVVMLYEGASRFLAEASRAIEQRDLVRKAEAFDRALAIIGELQNTLKLEEGGEIAASLDKLYTYMTERLLQASAKLDTRPIAEVSNLLQILNSAWTEIAQRAEAPAKTSEAKLLPLPAIDPSTASNRSLEVFG